MKLLGFPKKKRRRRKKKTPEKKLGVMDVILIVIGISLLAFTVTMIELFKIYGAVPDTLITCVFAVLGGECGIMGWIKTNKDRNRERQWQKEDEKEAEAASKKAAKETPPAEAAPADQPRNTL